MRFCDRIDSSCKNGTDQREAFGSGHSERVPRQSPGSRYSAHPGNLGPNPLISSFDAQAPKCAEILLRVEDFPGCAEYGNPGLCWRTLSECPDRKRSASSMNWWSVPKFVAAIENHIQHNTSPSVVFIPSEERTLIVPVKLTNLQEGSSKTHNSFIAGNPRRNGNSRWRHCYIAFGGKTLTPKKKVVLPTQITSPVTQKLCANLRGIANLWPLKMANWSSKSPVPTFIMDWTN